MTDHDLEQRRTANRPTVPMNRMSDRHYLNRVKGSRGAGRTTLVPPEMVEEDLVAIRHGDGIRLPNNHYSYRERIYAWEKDETYYPVSGPGFLIANRSTYKALQTLVRHGGPTRNAMRELESEQGMPSESVESAISMWRLRTNRGDNDDLLD
ncbi:MAG: hypothetical protein QM753_02270 [Thermomicrobiales bacterium]